MAGTIKYRYQTPLIRACQYIRFSLYTTINRPRGPACQTPPPTAPIRFNPPMTPPAPIRLPREHGKRRHMNSEMELMLKGYGLTTAQILALGTAALASGSPAILVFAGALDGD